MTSIARAVARFKGNPLEHLEPRLVHEACAAAGHVWRVRKLDPVVLLRLMILKVLHGNVSCRALGRLSGAKTVSDTVSDMASAAATLRVAGLRGVASRLW